MTMTTHSTADAPFAGPDWPPAILAEIDANAGNGRVGSTLVSATDRVRVWHLSIKPGERLPLHRHVNDYFWTVLTAGRAKSRFGDGRVQQTEYKQGDTKHHSFATGESMFHDLENIGETELVFVTVEQLDGANVPLPV